MSSAELPGNGGADALRDAMNDERDMDCYLEARSGAEIISDIRSVMAPTLSVRDYFAAKAMQAMLSRPDAQVGNLNDSLQTLLRAVSEMSYAAADEMLKARAPARCEGGE